MKVYESTYKELMFYVDGQVKMFANGRYQTEDKKEMNVLDTLPEVIVVDEAVIKSKPANKK